MKWIETPVIVWRVSRVSRSGRLLMSLGALVVVCLLPCGCAYGPPSEVSVVESIFEGLHSCDASRRKEALSTIANRHMQITATRDSIVQMAFEDPDPGVRDEAFVTLSILGPGSLEETVDYLISRLSGKGIEEESKAIRLLGRMGRRAGPAVNHLVQHLEVQNPSAPLAAEALGMIGRGAASAVPRLCTVFQDSSAPPYLRAEITLALGRIGDERGTALLREAAGSETALVRSAGARGMGEMGIASAGVLETLVQLTEDDNESVRRAACWALGQLGSSPPPVLGALASLLSDDVLVVRRTALLAIRRLRPRSPIPVKGLLRMAASDTLIANRIEGIGTIVHIGAAAKPELRTALMGGQVAEKMIAAEALAKIPDGWQILVNGSQNDDLLVRFASYHGMRFVAKRDAVHCEAALIQGLETKSDRASALVAIQELGLTSDETVTAVGKVLEGSPDDRFSVQRAVEILENAARMSPVALRLLEEAAQGHDTQVARSAKAALKGLRGKH